MPYIITHHHRFELVAANTTISQPRNKTSGMRHGMPKLACGYHAGDEYISDITCRTPTAPDHLNFPTYASQFQENDKITESREVAEPIFVRGYHAENKCSRKLTHTGHLDGPKTVKPVKIGFILSRQRQGEKIEFVV